MKIIILELTLAQCMHYRGTLASQRSISIIYFFIPQSIIFRISWLWETGVPGSGRRISRSRRSCGPGCHYFLLSSWILSWSWTSSWTCGTGCHYFFYYHLDLELEHVDQVNTFYYHLLHWKSKRFSLKQYHEKLPTYLINQKTHSSSYTENLTDGCWSPTRPSVFFTARHDGVSFWNMCMYNDQTYVWFGQIWSIDVFS